MSATQTIDYSALAKQAGAISSQPAQASSTVDYSALAKQAGAISSTPAPQPSLGEKVWQGAKESAIGQAVQGAANILAPPKTASEAAIHSVGGDPALAAYRAARSVVQSAHNMILSDSNSYQNAKQDFQRAVQDFHKGDWRNFGSSAVSLGSDVLGITQPEMATQAQNIRELSEGMRPGENLATPLTRQAIDAGTALAGAGVALPEAEPEAEAEEVPTKAEFESPSKPRIVKQIIQGKKVAQAPAQSAVRSAAQQATEAAGTDESVAANMQKPLISGNQTILDSHLSALRGLEQDAYDKMDEVAGFDVKAEKANLKNDTYKLNQLGNTKADKAARTNLTESIADSQARIADAEAKMKAAGVDPTEGDKLHTQRMAGTDFRKVLIQNTSSDGSTINVDGLLNASKKLRFSKYGDRLQQFFGSKQAADDFMSQLQQAKKLGQHAATMQKVAKWIAIVGGLSYEGRHLVGSVIGE